MFTKKQIDFYTTVSLSKSKIEEFLMLTSELVDTGDISKVDSAITECNFIMPYDVGEMTYNNGLPSVAQVFFNLGGNEDDPSSFHYMAVAKDCVLIEDGDKIYAKNSTSNPQFNVYELIEIRNHVVKCYLAAMDMYKKGIDDYIS
ncbi:hypothetical protein [Selenomonas sp. FC4001]|uniref:hypothetical protein n=1 Tax=Selenomonas sp. FC4001 TaxID=1408313 RepID=UPI000569BB2C|nr:hypothetical protein [Selenomonas sp. FC4001]